MRPKKPLQALQGWNNPGFVGLQPLSIPRGGPMAMACGSNRLDGLEDTVLWLACQLSRVCGMAVPCNTGQGAQDQGPCQQE